MVPEIELCTVLVDHPSSNAQPQPSCDFSFTGHQTPKPDPLFQLEQGGPPWTVEGVALSPTRPGYQATKPDVILNFEPREEPWKVEDEMQHQYFSVIVCAMNGPSPYSGHLLKSSELKSMKLHLCLFLSFVNQCKFIKFHGLNNTIYLLMPPNFCLLTKPSLILM
uniref:KRAB domain-containing protein n=1 Tax=Moschus moschiferus TaxID=68415 RepID=A0A8C6D835_MOSMO